VSIKSGHALNVHRALEIAAQEFPEKLRARSTAAVIMTRFGHNPA
jgi:Flp pilus assembly protein TadB